MELFGFEIKRKDEEKEQNLPSFVNKTEDDGAVVVSAGGAYGTYVDIDGAVRTEAELVTRYRDMALQAECDSAIDEIVNESIVIDDEKIVTIDLDKTKLSETVKKSVTEQFEKCLDILEFNTNAYEIFRRWYIDGRLYYNIIIDPKEPKKGIQEVRYIDPRKIRKMKEVVSNKVKTGPSQPGQVTVQKTINEYYIFNDKGFAAQNKPSNIAGPGNSPNVGLKIAKDTVLHVVSGLTDNQGKLVLSYLHKSIRHLNQLRMLEDALVIYRLARAPERRIWYIDVGNLPKMKAEQYLRDIMVKHKNRLVYDQSTGEIRDDRKFMSMLEDYWLPRKEGGRGTEVTTLPGGQTLGQMDDVLYFQKKFLNSLNVPVSRLNSDALFSIGRATEITRDELKFTRFIIRLRKKFSELFLKMLEKQLILKSIITSEDWKELKTKIDFNYAKDNYFNELKDNEILDGRANMARNMSEFAEKYFSNEWIRKNIFKQSDNDIEEQDKAIKKEVASDEPRWINPTIEQNISLKQQVDMQAQQAEQMNQPPETLGMQQQGAAPQAGSDGGPAVISPEEQMRQDELFIKQQKAKGNPSHRSIQDQAKYKAAVQRVAKNKNKQLARQPQGQVNA